MGTVLSLAAGLRSAFAGVQEALRKDEPLPACSRGSLVVGADLPWRTGPAVGELSSLDSTGLGLTDIPSGELRDRQLGAPGPDQFYRSLRTRTAHGVEVRQGGVWGAVDQLVVDPPYPGLGLPGYQLFELSLAPMQGDTIRLSGAPVGLWEYITVGELRVLGEPLMPTTEPTNYNVSLTVTGQAGPRT